MYIYAHKSQEQRSKHVWIEAIKNKKARQQKTFFYSCASCNLLYCTTWTVLSALSVSLLYLRYKRKWVSAFCVIKKTYAYVMHIHIYQTYCQGSIINLIWNDSSPGWADHKKKCSTGHLFKQQLLMCVKVRSSQHGVVVLSRIRLD